MPLKYRILLVVFSTLLLSTSIDGWYKYQSHIHTYMAEVDKRLLTAAIMAKAALPDSFHDNIYDEQSLSTAEYAAIINRHNKISQEAGLQYLWSNLIIGEKVVFTSASSTSKDIHKGDHAGFFEVHSDPAAFKSVIANPDQPHFSSFSNMWGTGRMVLAPFRDIHNRMYVFGASVSIDGLETSLLDIMYTTIATSVLLCCLGAITAMIFARSVTTPITRLSEAASLISTGDYHYFIDEKTGGPEITALAKAMNQLGKTVQGHEENLQSMIDKRTRELELNQAYLNSIIQNSAEGIITINRAGYIEMLNPSAEAMWGYEHNELLGAPLDTLLPDSSIGSHANYLKSPKDSLIKANRSVRELKGKHKFGYEFPIEISISSMGENEDIKFIAIIHDASENIAIREALSLSKETAERANKAKSDFLSRISHELRTPLNSILGFSQILLMDKSSPLCSDHEESVDAIRKSGEHLLSLIEEILDFNRIETGKVKYQFENVNVETIISDCIQSITPIAKSSGIKLTYENILKKSIYVDRVRIKQALFNLLTNAIKYNKKGGTVNIETKELDTYTLRITIEDTGMGFEEKDKGAIFEPFNRLGKENSEIPGMGFGLSIVKSLIEGMDGNIGYSSILGQGSSFYIDLPSNTYLHTEHTESTDRENERLLRNRLYNEKIKVLYIEDNLSNIDYVKKVLAKHYQYELLLSNHAEAGLVLAEDSVPDIILLDINLPGMDGFEAAGRLRANPKTARIPIVSLSADVTKETEINILRSGAKDLLSKPFTPQQLLDTIDKYVNPKEQEPIN